MTKRIALVPAAGTGVRMGGGLPKQYLPLLGLPLIHHALEALCAAREIESVAVVLSAADEVWDRHEWQVLGPKLQVLRCGGETRARSVLNGLREIADSVDADDWVLVHDAARPCLGSSHLDALLTEVGDDPVGGILAVPVADTLKRADGGRRILATVDRQALWQAQTPQMFRYGVLREALQSNPGVTDEAGAMEARGLKPMLVASDMTNLKVTFPLDLQLAQWILTQREAS